MCRSTIYPSVDHKQEKVMMIDKKQVVTRNGVTDSQKLDALILDMWQNGWQGRPVIVADMGGYVQAFTGSHRLLAAGITGVAPALVWLPHDLTEDDLADIHLANDDYDLLKVFSDLEVDHPEMAAVVAVMQQEVDSNNQE